MAASGLLEARTILPVADFAGEVLLLISGKWPQPHMKQATARMLCRYDKSTADVELTEVPAEWSRELQPD